MENHSGCRVSVATLDALEFPSFVQLIAELASTDVGRERLATLELAPDVETLDRRTLEFHEAASVLASDRLVPSFGEPLGEILSTLAGRETEVLGVELNLLGSALQAVRAASRRVEEADPECPILSEHARELADLSPFIGKIARTLDRRGQVRDDASERLVDLGRTVRRSRDAIYKELDSYGKKHRDDLAAEKPPMHDGRLVVLLRAGAKSRGGGLVHRGSGTGRSIYFEPFEVVESNNRMRESQALEAEERQRLLNELVDEARASVDEITAQLSFLALLDHQQAAYDFAELSAGRLVEVSQSEDFAAVEARHPLIDPQLAGLRRRALGHQGHTGRMVPLNLELSEDCRVLVLTGPNAGGKTVALKTLGLMALAAQAGLPFPAGKGSRAPRLESLVATVGDEQDLLEDRSTFSGRLLRLREAWNEAGPASLLLLDELGSGTDPEEGVALSVALLEGLLERRAWALITTHLAPLASAALEQDGASCAAMQFDSRSHQPTFELLPGSPAGSEALSLARRLGLPDAWLDRADDLIGSEQRDLRKLLAEVELVRDEVRRRSEELSAKGQVLQLRLEEAEVRERELEDEKVKVGRRAREEIESFRSKVSQEMRAEVERIREEMEAGRKRGLAAKAVTRIFESAPVIEVPEEKSVDPTVGDHVEHRALGWKGRIERLERGQAEVNVHGKRIRCGLEDLVVLETPKRVAPRTSPKREAPREGVVTQVGESELNLIGKRVEEALDMLDVYLDRALLTADGDVRVVHGHGTGRLRKAVREHLRRHPAVSAARPGRAEEGGDGATVISLRD